MNLYDVKKKPVPFGWIMTASSPVLWQTSPLLRYVFFSINLYSKCIHGFENFSGDQVKSIRFKIGHDMFLELILLNRFSDLMRSERRYAEVWNFEHFHSIVNVDCEWQKDDSLIIIVHTGLVDLSQGLYLLGINN